MLLMLGMIMDMAALILICTPIFMPIAVQLGMDPHQFILAALLLVTYLPAVSLTLPELLGT